MARRFGSARTVNADSMERIYRTRYILVNANAIVGTVMEVYSPARSSARYRRQLCGSQFGPVIGRSCPVRDLRLVGTRHEPEISLTDVSLRGPTYRENSHDPSHLNVGVTRNSVFSRFGSGARVGSIPIARSTFRCLACPCVALGRDLAYRPVPTVSTRLQPFLRSNASISPWVEFVLDGLIRPSSARRRPMLRYSQKPSARRNRSPTQNTLVRRYFRQWRPHGSTPVDSSCVAAY
jgi:hypothetical protein